MSRRQCFACCVHGAAVAARAAILRRIRRVRPVHNVVSLAMDTSRIREEGPTSQNLNLNFGTALLRGELRPRRLENLLAAPVLLEPLAVFIL